MKIKQIDPRHVVDDVITLILKSIADTEVRDHTARCIQDRFGAPAHQADNIVRTIEELHT